MEQGCVKLLSHSCKIALYGLLLRRGNFGDSAINKGYIAYFFIAHAQNGPISISGLKSDVIFVFHDPNFLWDAHISAIRVHLWQI